MGRPPRQPPQPTLDQFQLPEKVCVWLTRTGERLCLTPVEALRHVLVQAMLTDPIEKALEQERITREREREQARIEQERAEAAQARVVERARIEQEQAAAAQARVMEREQLRLELVRQKAEIDRMALETKLTAKREAKIQTVQATTQIEEELRAQVAAEREARRKLTATQAEEQATAIAEKVAAKGIGKITEDDIATAAALAKTKGFKQTPISPRSGLGFKGVEQYNGRYRTIFNVGGVRKVVGVFDDPLVAAKAYDDVARKAYGAAGWLNFPEVGECSAKVVLPSWDGPVRRVIDKHGTDTFAKVHPPKPLPTLPIPDPRTIHTEADVKKYVDYARIQGYADDVLDAFESELRVHLPKAVTALPLPRVPTELHAYYDPEEPAVVEAGPPDEPHDYEPSEPYEPHAPHAPPEEPEPHYAPYAPVLPPMIAPVEDAAYFKLTDGEIDLQVMLGTEIHDHDPATAAAATMAVVFAAPEPVRPPRTVPPRPSLPPALSGGWKNKYSKLHPLEEPEPKPPEVSPEVVPVVVEVTPEVAVEVTPEPEVTPEVTPVTLATVTFEVTPENEAEVEA